MARRIVNRKEKRADYEAAERLKKEGDETSESEEELEEDEEDKEEEEEAGEEDEKENEEASAEEEEKEEEKPPKKLKAKAAKPKPKRTRAPKITRMKVVWGVFDNSNRRVASFDYPKRKEAADLATKLTTDKKITHFVQPVKEPIEEKKG